MLHLRPKINVKIEYFSSFSNAPTPSQRAETPTFIFEKTVVSFDLRSNNVNFLTIVSVISQVRILYY